MWFLAIQASVSQNASSCSRIKFSSCSGKMDCWMSATATTFHVDVLELGLLRRWYESEVVVPCSAPAARAGKTRERGSASARERERDLL